MADQGRDPRGASPDSGKTPDDANRGSLSRPKPQGIISFNKKAQMLSVVALAVVFGLIVYGVSQNDPNAARRRSEESLLSNSTKKKDVKEAEMIKSVIPEAPVISRVVPVSNNGDGTLPKDGAWFEDVKGQDKKNEPTVPPLETKPPEQPAVIPPVEVKPAEVPPVVIAPPPPPPEDPEIAARKAADKAAAQAGTVIASGANAPQPPAEEKPETVEDKLAKQRLAFVQAATGNITSNYLSSMPTAALSAYEIKAGWLIPAVLEHAITTEVPSGMATARVSQNVYDTVTGNYLLIPQGSRLIGQYGGAGGATGSMPERLAVAWERIIFPDGSSVNLSTQPTVDPQGYAGMSDKVNQHWGRVLSGALLTSVFGAIPVYAASYAQAPSVVQGGATTTVVQDPKSQAIQNLGTQLGNLGQTLSQRFIAVPPSIEIRPGYRFYIRVQKDLAFLQPYEHGGTEYANSLISNEKIGSAAMKALQPQATAGSTSARPPLELAPSSTPQSSTGSSYGGAATKRRQ